MLDCAELIGRLRELGKVADVAALIVAGETGVEYVCLNDHDPLARLEELVGGGSKPCGFALFCQVGRRFDVIVNPLPELLESARPEDLPGVLAELRVVAQAIAAAVESKAMPGSVN